MRSATLGGYAIAYHPHLLTLGRQVIVRFEVLQPNGVLAIPDSHGATKVIHLADNPPTPTFTPEFGVIFSKDLTDFANLVRYLFLLFSSY
ncbi:MAG: hypothetical protein KME55_29770 [Nostoc indistinguendum CM1-VF10]|jgi:hypothetical protein|nr:hypothetical protein [Nostoc indistinguendum CM1-VF10]